MRNTFPGSPALCLPAVGRGGELPNCFRHLEESPLSGPNIKRLRGKLEGSFRYRIGGMRIIYSVDMESRKVYVETIGPRGDVYK